jgi:hypothetical protein
MVKPSQCMTLKALFSKMTNPSLSNEEKIELINNVYFSPSGSSHIGGTNSRSSGSSTKVCIDNDESNIDHALVPNIIVTNLFKNKQYLEALTIVLTSKELLQLLSNKEKQILIEFKHFHRRLRGLNPSVALPKLHKKQPSPDSNDSRNSYDKYFNNDYEEDDQNPTLYNGTPQKLMNHIIKHITHPDAFGVDFYFGDTDDQTKILFWFTRDVNNKIIQVHAESVYTSFDAEQDAYGDWQGDSHEKELDNPKKVNVTAHVNRMYKERTFPVRKIKNMLRLLLIDNVSGGGKKDKSK